jgi:hypothetical protein
MSLIDALTARAEAMGADRARRLAKALAADTRNPATAREDGRLGLSVPDPVDTLLTRPWLNWPSPNPIGPKRFGPDPLRRRA